MSSDGHLVVSCKPRLNVTSTYTKTLLPQFENEGFRYSNVPVNSEDVHGSPGNHPKTNGDRQQNVPCSVEDLALHEKTSHGSPNGKCPQTHPTNRPTFFAKLARRLTVKRSSSKPPLASLSSGDAVPVVNGKSSVSVPPGRKIRRWFSKYLMPTPKNLTLHKPPENYTNRAATFDILGERATAPVVCEFGSVPTTRRDLPQRNLSQSSLYNSQTGTGSLLDDNSVCNDPRVNVSTQVVQPQLSTSFNSSGATQTVGSDKRISSAFSSPSVTATVPPPRYLGVSLAAFGYTDASRKWVSAQTLESSHQPSFSSSSPPHAHQQPRHKSTSPAPVTTIFAPSMRLTAQRPTRLNIEPPSTTSTSMTNQSPVADENCITSTPVRTRVISGGNSQLSPAQVTYRVKKRNHSSSISAEANSSTTSQSHRRSHTTSIVSRQASQHHENWNRSSLIMLTVAQASPRGCGAVVGANAAPNGSPTPAGGSRFSSLTIETPSSPTRSFVGRRLVFGGDDADVSLPKVEEVPSATTPNATTSSSSHVADDSSSLVVVKTAATLQEEEEEEEEEEKEKSGDIGVGGGTYFLGVVEDTTTALRADVEKIEADLVNNEFSEEVSGQLRTTVGKVNLLISQKFAQFRGLCNNCIEPATTDFVTLPSDLEGFWAMVMLQVDDVRAMIASVDTLRQNNWKVASEDDGDNSKVGDSTARSRQNGPKTPTSAKRTQQQKAATSAVSPTPLAGASSKARQNKESADLARAQARERLKAAKRQYMMAHREANSNTTTPSVTETATNGDQQQQTTTFLVM